MTRSVRSSRGASVLSGSRSPSVESVNKWKIPHYYRRSPSGMSQTSSSLDCNIVSAPGTPNINIMNSPKKVLLEDRKGNDGNATGNSSNRLKKNNGTRSKRNNKRNPGEMVFVNYTVQDGASDIDNNALQNELLQPPPKKKSSKSRMLKIFGNSKNESLDSSPNQSVKRSYNSLLKYAPSLYQNTGSSGAAGNTSNNDNITDNSNVTAQSFCDSDDEVVPTSHVPSQFDPFSLGAFQPFMADNISLSTRFNCSNDNGTVSNTETNNTSSTANGEQFVISNSTVLGSRTADENDASIAFSKMFSRKRADTGGSMNSLASLNGSLQQQQQILQNQANSQLQHSQSYSNLGNVSVPGCQRNLSFSSISSYNNKFSPARTASPARPRSARSSLRHSRDSNSFSDSLPESSTPHGVTHEVFLDAQSAGKSKSIVATGSKSKRKQDSMPDLHRIYTSGSAITSNASAALSSSLVTPPAFPLGQTATSSTSSTPNMLELNNSTSNGTLSYRNTSAALEIYGSRNTPSAFYKDSSAEILLQDSDMPTPIENVPALKGIPKTTLEEKEEDDERQEDVNNTTKNTHHTGSVYDRMRVPPNNEAADYVQVIQGSSTGSSQVDSLMTNSLSATTTNTIVGNHAFQDHVNPILNKDMKIDPHTKLVAKPAAPEGKIDLTSRDMKGDNKSTLINGSLSKINMDFNFENSNSFFRQSSPQQQDRVSQKLNLVKNHPQIDGQFDDFRPDTANMPNPQQSYNKIFPEPFANLSVEDMETSVEIPHDLFNCPSESNHNAGSSEKPVNFPFYAHELGDFSYL